MSFSHWPADGQWSRPKKIPTVAAAKTRPASQKSFRDMRPSKSRIDFKILIRVTAGAPAILGRAPPVHCGSRSEGSPVSNDGQDDHRKSANQEASVCRDRRDRRQRPAMCTRLAWATRDTGPPPASGGGLPMGSRSLRAARPQHPLHLEKLGSILAGKSPRAFSKDMLH